MECPNYKPISKHLAECLILKESGVQYIAAETRSGSPCHNCKTEWKEVAPTKDSLTNAMVLVLQNNGKISLPTITEQVKSFVSTLAKWIGTGFQNVPADEQRLRLEICKKNTCGMYDSESGRCNACGCFCEAKSKFSHETCPANLWPEIGPEYKNQPSPGKCGSCGNK